MIDYEKEFGKPEYAAGARQVQVAAWVASSALPASAAAASCRSPRPSRRQRRVGRARSRRGRCGCRRTDRRGGALTSKTLELRIGTECRTLSANFLCKISEGMKSKG